MVARVNSAEGGADGVNVTVANSGGTSGDPWDSVGWPTGASLKFATAAAYKGARGYRFAQNSSGSTGSYARWKVPGWQVVRSRFYLRTPAYPTQSAIVAGIARTDNATYAAELVLNPGGRLLLVDNQNTVLWTSAAAIPLNSWVRVEWIAVPGTPTAKGALRVGYGLADAALTETFVAASANTGTSGFGSWYVGKLSGTWATSFDVDDLAADDASTTVFMGVSAASGTPVVVDADPTPPAAATRTWPPPDPYSEAIRSSLALWYTVDASYRGVPVEGATDLRPTGGTITDTTKPGVRRTLNLELALDPPDLDEKLAPIGTALTVVAHVQYTNRQVVDIPMGVFDVDSEKFSEAGGSLSLTAPDKWVRIQRARFIGPAPSSAGILVRDQLALLVKDAIAPGEPVNITATSEAVMPAVVWEKDRDKAVIELAASIGAWVYFDRQGVATVADVPTSGADANFWLIDASADGVLIDVDREQSRTNTYNVVVVSSSATDGEKFPVQYVWDDDPSSPTYAGTAVPFASGTAFGIVPYYFDTPILSTVQEARAAGLTILSRVVGQASTASMGSVPNPAIDAWDVIGLETPRAAERHVADTVTHPLALGTEQHIDGRSTRAADIEGGS